MADDDSPPNNSFIVSPTTDRQTGQLLTYSTIKSTPMTVFFASLSSYLLIGSGCSLGAFIKILRAAPYLDPFVPAVVRTSIRA